MHSCDNGKLCITEDFLRLYRKEQDELIQFFAKGFLRLKSNLIQIEWRGSIIIGRLFFCAVYAPKQGV